MTDKKVVATTENGTIYEFNLTRMTWRKTKLTNKSGHTRSLEGNLETLPTLRLGQEIAIRTSNPTQSNPSSLILTSRVTKLKYVGFKSALQLVPTGSTGKSSAN